MADVKLSALPAHTAPLATDYVPIVTAGATKRATLLTLAMNVYDVRRYGAKCDGTTDDSTAVAAAFTAMLNASGHPDGTLYIPGNCHVHTTIDLDCGYSSNPASSSNPAAAGGERFVVVCDGLLPVAGIGTAISLHHGYSVDAHVRIVGGGQSGDVGLLVDALSGCCVTIEALRFAGTVLKAPGTNNVTTARHWVVNAQMCGQAIDFTNVNAFGWFDDIWDVGCASGSTFVNCADIGIGHYENWSPATHTVGVLFSGCNLMNIGIITLGDRATEALLKITGNGDFGNIAQVRVSGGPSYKPGCGLLIEDNKTVTIGSLVTKYCPKGLYIKGCTKTVIGIYQSLTGDDVPIYIDKGATYTAPILHIAKALIRYCNNEACIVTADVTGGRLVIGGEIELENVAASATCNTFDSEAAAFHIYAEGLQKVTRGTLDKAFETPDSATLVHITGGSIGNWP